ncbi:MAG: PD-(D/E)XK nuclease family protein [Clostridiales bacterium]|nr:PD-(D/E)XK nuclease family protein [Clostridiales bacterium]
MVTFITGRSGSGKTEYCFKSINALAQKNEKNMLLITPEQYNFTAERRLLSMLGEDKIGCVENSSFTRMYMENTRLYGGAVDELSKGARAAIMKKAITNVSAGLQLFGKRAFHTSFVKSMLDVYDEFKACGTSRADVFGVSQALGESQLTKKLADISLIIDEYEKITAGTYLDSACTLERLYDMLLENDYLAKRHVFIDGFNSFAENEYKIISLIFKKCAEVTVTLGLDSDKLGEEYGLFSHVNAVYKKLKSIAHDAGCEYKTKTLYANHKTRDEALLFCEKNIFSAGNEIFEKTPESIEIYSAKNIADECDYVSIKIKQALRNSVRARDIAVICRDKDKYSGELTGAFKKYEIPYFNDERQAVETQPLIVFIRYLLNTALYSFRSDDILSLVKTGLTDITPQDAAALENYIYVWSINGYKKWSAAFEAPPGGFKAQMTESDKRRLESLEKSRLYLFEKLNKFKNSIKNSTPAEIGKSIYYALFDFNVNKNLKGIAKSLYEIKKDSLAEEQGRVWELVMNILNQLAEIQGGAEMPLGEYADLFAEMAKSEDLGVLPQGLDNVIFASADRVRLDSSKYVFILGANEGEFPLAYTNEGILSESDRALLLKNNMRLYSSADVINMQERYFAYAALAAAGEKLTVCYRGAGANPSPSSIIISLKEIFPNIKEIKHSDLDEMSLVESRAAAFELMAQHFDDGGEFYESLKEYFKDDSGFAAVKRIAENEEMKIDAGGVSTALFGRDMYLSASRVEDYFNCSFRYFCKYGVSARPLLKAEMNPMETGTVIHYVLEKLISQTGSSALKDLSDSAVKISVDNLLAEYLQNEMGANLEFTSRFKYQFFRLSKMLYSVVSYIKQEFSQCAFESAGFEVVIDDDGEVKPKVIALSDGGTVRLKGIIDRVDVLEKGSEKYVRIVDYKSGVKEFELSDILYGLNLQMFVYLFTICAEQNNRFSATPAGVLYMHAARSVYNVSSENAKADVQAGEKKEFQMQGLLLYDDEHDILRDMEEKLERKYIPVKKAKNGDISGSVATLGELGKISKKVERLVAQMGESLHRGNIEQNPIDGKHHDKTCEFCDYSAVCAFRRSINKREAVQLSRREFFDELDREVRES